LSSRLPENERLLIKADVSFYEQDYAQAVEVLEEFLNLYPGNVFAHYMLAKVYAWAGDDEKALEPQEFVVQNQKTASYVLNLAAIYAAKGMYQKVEDLCRSHLQNEEENPFLYRWLCDSHLCRRQFDLALVEAEKAYLLAPNEAFCKWYIGNVLLFKGDPAGAEKVYQEVATAVKYGAGRRIEIGIPVQRRCGSFWLLCVALTRGKFDQAIDLIRGDLKTAEDNQEWIPDAYRNLAHVLESVERYEDALAALTQAQALAAESAPLGWLPEQKKYDLFNTGRIQAKLHLWDDASKTAARLKTLVDKAITTKQLRWYEYILGEMEFGRENYGKAADFFSRACNRLQFESDNLIEHALFFDALARTYYESGKLKKAREEYEKITRLTLGRLIYGDLYAKAFYMLGKIAEQQGDKARARENYGQFLELWKDADPGLPEVDDARTRLARLGNSN
jgi:tetratricopeptide (TPR) repeat protein